MLWAIADLHLSFGVAKKGMEIFGDHWIDHAKKIEEHWREKIKEEDLVLIAGDISWAMRLDEVKPDLEWIGSLPGTKVMIRGNHDYWWGSLKQIEAILPPCCHLIQNNSFTWNEVAIAGARLWDVPGLDFSSYITFKENKAENKLSAVNHSPESEKLYLRELMRLETSLKSMNKQAKKRIVMTHYPPVGLHLEKTAVSDLLEKYKVDLCLFGHLHNLKKEKTLFGELNGVIYQLTACDYLENFSPLKIDL